MVDIILRLMPIFIHLSLIGFESVKFQLPCDFNFCYSIFAGASITSQIMVTYYFMDKT